jgi:hypothetical protein
MVTIVALRLCGLLPRLKLIDLFVKVGLCADVRAFAQTTQTQVWAISTSTSIGMRDLSTPIRGYRARPPSR